jgi:hypothetical protein
MTRSKQNFMLRLLFAFILSCLTASLFAQSTSLAASPSVDQPTAQANSGDDAETTGLPQRTRINWAEFDTSDKGYESSVAIHPSGLIIEVHSSGASRITYTGLFYRIGKLDPVKGKVTWGDSHRWVAAGTAGSWPAVAITQEGYAILTYSNAFSKSDGILKYYVGTLNLQGGTDQLINFKVNNVQYDTGFHNSIAVNYNGTIAEAHESNGGKGIFYRLGHLNAPGSGDFSIVWDSGVKGQPYDNGIDPHIAINDNDDVVEVHQAAADDYKLHYTRGRIAGNQITNFTTHPRYSDFGSRPSVVLMNDGYVIEMHGANYNSRDGLWEYFNRVGNQDKQQTTLVNWVSNTRLGYVESNGGIASNGSYLITTATRSGHIYYSWAIAP